jgi:hypothetical protein
MGIGVDGEVIDLKNMMLTVRFAERDASVMRAGLSPEFPPGSTAR